MMGANTKADEVGTGYGKLVQDLRLAENNENVDDEKDARAALGKVGLRGGVDTTLPTAEFVPSGLEADSRFLDDEFVVEVADGRTGSGINEGANKGAPRALVASLEIRNADGIQCIIDNEPSDNARLCGDPFRGLSVDRDIIRTTLEGAETFAGKTIHKRLTLQATIRLGRGRRIRPETCRSRSAALALNDTRFDPRASLRVGRSRDNTEEYEYELDYSLEASLDDDLSIRDYYLAFNVEDGGVASRSAVQAEGCRRGR